MAKKKTNINESAARTCVIYARFSSHNQTEQSIEGQLRICYDYAKREGIQVVGEYIDRAISGRSDDRPDFQRMIKDAKKQAFQYVLVYKLDRFARNRYDSAIYKVELKKHGVKVISAMENIGDNPESIILEAVLEASAEYYSIDLSQKVKRGRYESAKKGKWAGGHLPPGLIAEDGYIKLNEDYAPYIRQAFSDYADGEQKTTILEYLNSHGVRGSMGRPISQSTLLKMLHNEKYAGILDQSGVRLENGCPALVDPETWDRVQNRLKSNKRQGATYKADVRYLLTGKLFCGHCGEKMVGVSGTAKSGTIYYYYSCQGRRHKTCKKKNEKKDFIEWYVCEQTVQFVLQPDRIKQIAKAVVAEYTNEFGDKEIKALENRIASLDRDMREAVEMALHVPSAAKQALYDKMEQIGSEKESLEVDLSKLRVANQITFTEKDIESWLKTFCNGDLMDLDFRQKMIDTFINSIYLFDDKVIIYYNVRDGKQVSYIDMSDDLEGLLEEMKNSVDNSTESHVVRISEPKAVRVVKYTNTYYVINGGIVGILKYRTGQS